MLTRREVGVGKCYVKDNAQIAREVIAEVPHRKVVYNAYDLRTGRLLHTPHQICSRNQLIRWADREATHEESAKLLRNEAMDIFVRDENKIYSGNPVIEKRKSKLMTEVRTVTPQN
jgi:hypothetical protein